MNYLVSGLTCFIVLCCGLTTHLQAEINQLEKETDLLQTKAAAVVKAYFDKNNELKPKIKLSPEIKNQPNAIGFILGIKKKLDKLDISSVEEDFTIEVVFRFEENIVPAGTFEESSERLQQMILRLLDTSGEPLLESKITAEHFKDNREGHRNFSNFLSGKSSTAVPEKKNDSSAQPVGLKIDSNAVFAGEGELFGIELRKGSKNSNSPLKPAIHDGTAQVSLEKEDEYLIVLHNKADFEVAVMITIDGVNMFVDAKDAAKQSRVIVPKHGQVILDSWYITANKGKHFQIGGYEDSIAFRELADKLSLGIVTATFSASWPIGTTPPAGDSEVTPKGDVGTKQGRDVEANWQSVERNIGKTRAIVSIKYDR